MRSKMKRTPIKTGTIPLSPEPPFFKRFKLERTPIKQGTRPPLQELPFFYAFQNETHPNRGKHPCPLSRSHYFFTRSKLKCTLIKKDTLQIFTLFKLKRTPKKEAASPPLQELPFSHVFQTGTHPKETRHPCPLFGNPRFKLIGPVRKSPNLALIWRETSNLASASICVLAHV